jgi:hypothetical protein
MGIHNGDPAGTANFYKLRSRFVLRQQQAGRGRRPERAAQKQREAAGQRNTHGANAGDGQLRDDEGGIGGMASPPNRGADSGILQPAETCSTRCSNSSNVTF